MWTDIESILTVSAQWRAAAVCRRREMLRVRRRTSRVIQTLTGSVLGVTEP